jgi:predicted phage gp36 major capsid-like protein
VNNRQPNGKTPNDELAEQLQLLSRQADALHSSRHSQTSAELTSTGNFLRERFGHHHQGAFDFGIE